MLFSRFSFFSLIFLFIAQSLSAQTIIVTGRLADSATLKPLNGVQIMARTFRDSTYHPTAYSDSNGMFALELRPGGYRFNFTSEGYKSAFRFIRGLNTDQDLGNIILVSLAGTIGTVDIIVNLPVQQKGDTTEYSAGAFKVNPDATAEDLVKKLPGITVENGKVKAQGEEVKKVTLDGKDFFGDDAQTALRNLPAEVVDKIQVFDRMSDQSQFTGFDDGNSVKAINLKTRSGKANGQFGKIYAGAGTDSRHQSGLVYNNFKGDRRLTLLGLGNNINQQNFTSQDLLGLSSGGSGGRGRGGPGGYYSQPATANFLVDQANGITSTYSSGLNFNNKYGKHWTVAGSYFYSNSSNKAEQEILRTYPNTFNPAASQLYRQISESNNDQQNHRINARIEYEIDSNSSFIYTPSVSFQNNKYRQVVDANNSVANNELNRSGSNYTISGSGYTINNDLLFRHRFKKPQRTLTVSGQQRLNKNESETRNYSQNRTFLPFDTAFATDQLVYNSSPATNYSGRFTWTEPAGKKAMWQFDYRYGLELNETDKKTLNLDAVSEQYNLFDTTLSNLFSTRYNTHQPGLMYRFRGEKTSLSFGSGYQWATLKGEQVFPNAVAVNKSFQNLLPRLFANIRFSKTNNLRVMFRSSTQIPSISQFQEVINTSNPILLSTGNPNLKQSTSQNLVLRYNSSNTTKLTSFFIGVYGTQTSNYITNAIEFFGLDTQISEGFTAIRGAQLIRPVNLNGYWNNRIISYYGFPWKLIKSNMNVNGAYAISRTPGMVNNVSNNSLTQNISGGISASSNISESVDFSFGINTNYYNAINSSQTSLNNSYFNHTATARGNYIYKKKLVLNTELAYNKFDGLSSDFNQQFLLWNAALGYKFMKNQSAEFRLSCFDILKQNRAIARSITETYIEDSYTRVLTRYLMATFTWNFRKFGNGGSEPKPEEDHHHYMRPPGVPGAPPPSGRPPF